MLAVIIMDFRYTLLNNYFTTNIINTVIEINFTVIFLTGEFSWVVMTPIIFSRVVLCANAIEDKKDKDCFTPHALLSPIFYPRNKHEVERMTRCRDMPIRNFPRCEVGRRSVSRQYIHILMLYTPLRKERSAQGLKGVPPNVTYGQNSGVPLDAPGRPIFTKFCVRVDVPDMFLSFAKCGSYMGAICFGSVISAQFVFAL